MRITRMDLPPRRPTAFLSQAAFDIRGSETGEAAKQCKSCDLFITLVRWVLPSRGPGVYMMIEIKPAESLLRMSSRIASCASTGWCDLALDSMCGCRDGRAVLQRFLELVPSS
jgi:hypothetical protein